MGKHYCYILECNDKTLYTGYATDPQKRLIEHNESDKGAKYTRVRRPCALVYVECFDSRSEAMKREYYIKHKLNRTEKEELIKSSSNQLSQLL